jgi:hypothetical protein
MWRLAVVAQLACGCGARTGMILDDHAPSASDGGLDASLPGIDAAVDSAGEDRVDVDVVTDASVERRCVLQPAGPPMELGAFPDQHADAPSLAVIDRGGPGQAPNVAFQAFRSGGSGLEHAIFAGRFEVGPLWPGDVWVAQPLVKVGTDSHGWAVMTRAPATMRQVALSWYGDPGLVGRTMFRTIDVDTWSPHDPIDLSFEGGSALDLALGAETGSFGAGYAGDGYGLVWRSDEWSEPAMSAPVVAVVGLDGGVLAGPHPVAAPSEYPGASPAVVWSGTTYLLATSFGECVEGDALCTRNSVVITRFRPASGDAVDDSGVDYVTAIPSLHDGWRPRRAWLASHGTGAWVAWSEGPAGDEDGTRTIRLARLDEQGAVEATRIVAEEIALLQSVRLEAAPFGVAVVWPEEGNPELSYNTPGRSRIVASLHDRELSPIGPALRMDATQFGSYGWVTAASIDEPRSLLLTWPGYPPQGGMGVAWLARIDCVEEVTDAGVDATVDAAPAQEYFAVIGPIGALDRMSLGKRDFQRDLCFRVNLARPLDFAPYDIALPYQWGIESAVAIQGADKCFEPAWSESTAVADWGTGSITFEEDPEGWMPCTVDIDVALGFDATQPWTPASEPLIAKGVEVEGACAP